MTMTKEIAQAHLDSWLAADTAVASGQSYVIGDVQVTRVDARTIRQQISYWQGVVNSYSAQEAGATNITVATATFGARR